MVSELCHRAEIYLLLDRQHIGVYLESRGEEQTEEHSLVLRRRVAQPVEDGEKGEH